MGTTEVTPCKKYNKKSICIQHAAHTQTPTLPLDGENSDFNLLVDQDQLDYYKNTDNNLYIETLILFNENINNLFTSDDEIKIILSNTSTLNSILNKVDFEDRKLICNLKNSIGRYCLSECDESIIMKYIDYYSYEELLTRDKTNNPQIFNFLQK